MTQMSASHTIPTSAATATASIRAGVDGTAVGWDALSLAEEDLANRSAGRWPQRVPGIMIAVRPTSPPVAVTAGPFAGHVVVGIDDGPSSQAAVRFAFAYADRHHLPLAAVHANAVDPAGAWVDDVSAEIHLMPHAFDLDLLEAAVAAAHDTHPDVPVRRFVLREAADEALVSASKGAYLLVVGDRGRGPVASRLFGSVSRHVVRHAHCSVAVVHEPGGVS